MVTNRMFWIASTCFIGMVFIVSLIVWYGAGSKRLARTDRLVVAMMSGWAPFMTVNDRGQFEGFDVDVAREIAKRMNKELEIIDAGSLAPTFIALDQGKVDLILSGLDITKERTERLIMVPYAGEQIKQFYLLFWQQIPLDIKSIEDLARMAGAVVCSEPGSAQERFLDTVNDVEQKPLGKLEEMILDVQYGKSTALLVEPQVARRIQKANPGFKSLAVPLPEAFQVFGMGIAIARNNKALALQISSVIEQMKSEKVLESLEIRWQLKGE